MALNEMNNWNYSIYVLINLANRFSARFGIVWLAMRTIRQRAPAIDILHFDSLNICFGDYLFDCCRRISQMASYVEKYRKQHYRIRISTNSGRKHFYSPPNSEELFTELETAAYWADMYYIQENGVSKVRRSWLFV